MEETLRSHLTICAERFEAASGVSQATIGKRALNDNTFFGRLGEGRGFTIRTYDRAMHWMAEHWPDQAKWPDDVPRPSVEVSKPTTSLPEGGE